MQDHPLFSRAKQLIAVEIEGKHPPLSERFSAIMAKNAAVGRLNSGATLKMLHRAACEELQERSMIVFAAFVRAHGAFMPGARGVSRQNAKSFTRSCVEGHAREISPTLATGLAKITDQRTIERAQLDLSGATELTARKLDVEVDLHFDHLDSSSV